MTNVSNSSKIVHHAVIFGVILLLLSFSVVECKAAKTTEKQSEGQNDDPANLLLPAKVKRGFQNMVADWDSFKAMFASKATIKWCVEESDVCRTGTFDSHFGTFRDAVSVIHVEDSSLTSAATAYSSAWLQHFTNYIETPTGCSATWSGFAAYDFDNKGYIERMVLYSEKSKDLLTCIAQYHEDMKNQKNKRRQRR